MRESERRRDCGADSGSGLNGPTSADLAEANRGQRVFHGDGTVVVKIELGAMVCV
jgi:hypothetical protein